MRIRLEPGQVTTSNVLGPTVDSGLAVEARVQDDEVVGTVTNSGTVALHQVAVFGPGGVEDIGTLAPGESNTFSFGSQPLPMGFSLADRVWAGTSDPWADADEIAELGVWSNASMGRVMYPSGLVRAAGWTTELSLGIDVAGGVTTTAVVTTVAPIRPSGVTLPAASVRSAMVRTPFSQFGNGTADTIYRFVLPPQTNLGQQLVLRLPPGLDAIELWNGSGWIESPGRRGSVAVSPNHIVNGVVMARVVNNGDFFPGDQSPTLRGATAADLAP